MFNREQLSRGAPYHLFLRRLVACPRCHQITALVSSFAPSFLSFAVQHRRVIAMDVFVSSPLGKEFFRRLWLSSHCRRCANSHLTSPPFIEIVLSVEFQTFIADLCRSRSIFVSPVDVDPISRSLENPRSFPRSSTQLSLAVRFEGYNGPTWDKANPKVVPIPMVTRRCNKGCCESTYCPLSLSYGVTAHTIQGQSAGPVDEGQPKNAVDCVVFYPGNNKFEGNNPGLLYMGTSRAITSGTGNMDSAMYFSGQEMNTHRVLSLKYQRDGTTPYKKVQLREKWIERLDKHTIVIRPQWSTKEKEELVRWAKTFRMSTSDLEIILSRKEWRTTKR